MKIKIISSLLLILFINNIGYSQRIKGRVKDENGDNLESATIYAESIEGNSLLSYTISNSEGNFEFDVLSDIDFTLIISYIGYENFKKKIKHSENEINLNVIQLKPQMQKLTAVELTGKAPPITIKNDTIEFNAGSYATKADS